MSLTGFQNFHTIDREAYAKLVFQLGFDSDTSKKIVAFWLWLETKGYRNFVYNSMNLTDSSLQWLCGLALESTLCLGCLDQESFLQDYNLPLMSKVSNRVLCLEFVYLNKEDAKANVIMFVRDVCDRAFSDLVPTSNLNYDDQVQVFEPAVELLQPQVNILRKEVNEEPQVNILRKEVNEADNDRTLFATFSKGHPITRDELFDFFIRRYGEDCVEDIRMGNCSGRDQSLFARVIVRLPAYITMVLGENEVMQFNIHNKDVRVRRFIPKRASAAAAAAASAN